MRVVQIIDSLDAGGAERMAVNYANALAEKIEFSALVCTRKQGILKNQIDSKVSYFFANKKKAIDLKSIFRIKVFLKENKINIVHAHGTSFFTAVLLKFFHPRIKIIWHEHYGARVKQSRKDNLILLFSSIFFSSVFVVNHELEIWVKKNLFVKNVFYVPNFATSDIDNLKTTFLKGNEDKRLVCLANLKNPKNHILQLTAFKEMKLEEEGWTLHFIGKDYNDEYSNKLKNFIINNNLQDSVFIYDSQNDIQHILSQATIGILSSTAEGFPVTLLEYGLANLPVLSTSVGYCSIVIHDNYNGLLFNPEDKEQFIQQFYKIISDKSQRDGFALHLYNEVINNYSKEKVIDFLLSKYNIL